MSRVMGGITRALGLCGGRRLTPPDRPISPRDRVGLHRRLPPRSRRPRVTRWHVLDRVDAITRRWSALPRSLRRLGHPKALVGDLHHVDCHAFPVDFSALPVDTRMSGNRTGIPGHPSRSPFEDGASRVPAVSKRARTAMIAAMTALRPRRYVGGSLCQPARARRLWPSRSGLGPFGQGRVLRHYAGRRHERLPVMLADPARRDPQTPRRRPGPNAVSARPRHATKHDRSQHRLASTARQRPSQRRVKHRNTGSRSLLRALNLPRAPN